MSHTAIQESRRAPLSDVLNVTFRLLRWVLALGLFAYGLGAWIGALFIVLDRSDHALIEFIKTAYWVGLWPLPVIAVLLVIGRRWRLLMVYSPAMVAFLLYYTPMLLPKSANVPDNTPRLTVQSFNILSATDEYAAIAQIILETDADIVGVQELGIPAAEYLNVVLANAYPHQALHPQENGWQGQGVFSKYAITEDEYWQYTDFSFIPYTEAQRAHGHQRVEINFDSQTLVVYNIHPYPPIDWRGGVTIIPFPEDDVSHQMAMQRVTARIMQETAPTILLGDFNFSDQHTEYQRIVEQFTDAYRSVSVGPGYTYPAGGFGPLPPLMRLDYVFHSEHFAAVAARVLPYNAPSDHRPVLAELALVAP